jgi:hypothetical protein
MACRRMEGKNPSLKTLAVNSTYLRDVKKTPPPPPTNFGA